MFKTFTLALALSFLAFIPLQAMASSPVAIVDVQRILLESKVGKNIHTQMETLKDKFLDDLSKKEKSLRDQEKELIEEQKTLSKEEFAKKASAFEGALAKTRREAQEQKKALDKSYSAAMDKARVELEAIVTAIASEKGYVLVLSRANVIVAKDSINITDEALKRLDVAISKVSLSTKK